jgi:hypothetical protein
MASINKTLHFVILRPEYIPEISDMNINRIEHVVPNIRRMKVFLSYYSEQTTWHL